MKNEYTKPEIFLCRFTTEDIITDSGVADSDENESAGLTLRNYPVESNLEDIIS